MTSFTSNVLSHRRSDLMVIFCFSAQIKPEIISELSDKKWQTRGEALQKVIITRFLLLYVIT